MRFEDSSHQGKSKLANLASLLAVAVAPRKGIAGGIGVRLPVGSPFFLFCGGLPRSSFLVLSLFVLVGSVGIASFTLRLPPLFTSPANYSSNRRSWSCALCVFGGGTAIRITCPSILRLRRA